MRALSTDLAVRLTQYETGEASYDEEVDLFQELVDSGLAWSLQGSYGRHAARLIDAGLVEAVGCGYIETDLECSSSVRGVTTIFDPGGEE